MRSPGRTTAGPPARTSDPMRRLLLALCVLVVVAGVGAALGARWAWALAHEPYRGFEDAEVENAVVDMLVHAYAKETFR